MTPRVARSGHKLTRHADNSTTIHSRGATKMFFVLQVGEMKAGETVMVTGRDTNFCCQRKFILAK